MGSPETEGEPPRSAPTVVKRKVCLVGEEGVGKTSLIRRFVRGAFDEVYLRTLGAVASKKQVEIMDADLGPARVDMMILDITGKRTFMELFRDAYFRGAAGVLAAFDLTRRKSLVDLVPWIDGVRHAVGEIPVIALGNKADLVDQAEVADDDVREVLSPRGVRSMKTSAKTGENVEEAFLSLAREMLRKSV